MRHFAGHLHLHHVRDPDDATQVVYSVELGVHEADGADLPMLR
jgi:hypothetical protein